MKEKSRGDWMASHELLILGIKKLIRNPPTVCFSVIEEWQKRGGQPWQLIEPVDGFHPNEVSVATWWSLEAICLVFSNTCMHSYVGVYPNLFPEVFLDCVNTCVTKKIQ